MLAVTRGIEKRRLVRQLTSRSVRSGGKETSVLNFFHYFTGRQYKSAVHELQNNVRVIGLSAPNRITSKVTKAY